MTPAEARAFIADVQKQRGTTPNSAPVTSMEQLLDVLLHDDIGRFESAEQLVEGKPGVDALTVHATIELSWSDAYSTVATLVQERWKRADVERRRLTQEKDSGRTFTDAEKKELEQAEKDVDFDTNANNALKILAKDHLQTAGAIMREVVRQFPDDERSLRVAAFYYLLSEEYRDFDAVMKRLQPVEATDASLQYLRAVESLNRYGIPKDASGFLQAALKLNPAMVRAQAKLVLTEVGVDASYAELQKLRAIAPNHPVVNIAGPAIISEYETATALAKARAAHQQPGVAPAPPSSEPPAPSGTLQPAAAPTSSQ